MVCVDPGSIVDRGHEEYYESVPFQLPAGARAQEIAWKAQVPDKTWVGAQLRSADTEAGLAEASWRGPDGGDSWYGGGDPVRSDEAGRWLQYRLVLGACNSLRSPRISEVAITYAD